MLVFLTLDISFLSLYRSVDCVHCKARTKRVNFDGHLNCRHHSPCNENNSGWWSRQNCFVYEHLWNQCKNGSEDASMSAKSSLRLWIRGYQKNQPGHYVGEEEIKEFLFPTGLLPMGPPQTSTPIRDVEEVMDTEEEVLQVEHSFSNTDLGLSQAEEDVLLTSPLITPGHPPPSQGMSLASLEPATPSAPRSEADTLDSSNLGISKDMLAEMIAQICKEKLDKLVASHSGSVSSGNLLRLIPYQVLPNQDLREIPIGQHLSLLTLGAPARPPSGGRTPRNWNS